MIDGLIIMYLSPDSADAGDFFRSGGCVLLLVAFLPRRAVIHLNVLRLENKPPIQVPG